MYCECGKVVENRDTGLCASCSAEIRKQERTQLKEKKPVKKVSVKRASQNQEYARLRKEYLEAYPVCEVVECHNLSKSIHHIQGREGEKLTDTNFFLATCTECHEQIHNNPQWSLDNGYMILRSI